jgi:hypothetical protein
MTPQQQAEIWRRPPPPQDKRPWWRRLTLRPFVKLAPNLKRPIKALGLTGKLDW